MMAHNLIRRPAALASFLALMLAPMVAQAESPRPVVSLILQPEAEVAGPLIGTVEATTTVAVGFELLGRLISRPVQEGESVTRGQELARIDARALSEDRDAARAAVENLDVSLATATRARQRAEELAGRGVAASSMLETAERNEAVARANLEQARATLARAEDALSRAVLHAPFDGVVIGVRHEPGSTVAAGDPVLVLASPGGRNLQLTLPVALLSGEEAVQTFHIHAPKLPPEGITGRLLRIDPASVAQTRMRRVWIELGPEAAGLALGELVEVRPDLSRAARMLLPAAAIGGGEAPFVWQITQEGTRRQVRRTPVTLSGTAADGRVWVSGLSAGAEIVVRGVESLRDGQEVGPALAGPAAAGALPLTSGVK